MGGNPLALLQPVLDLLVQEAAVLPASGRAVVELAMPSPGEIYDREANPETRVQGIWETDPDRLYRLVPPLHRWESHGLRFFARGSTRVFFLGTLLEHERSTPIQIAQIGVAVLERQGDGAIGMPREAVETRTALVMDTKELSDDLRTAIERAMPQGYGLWNSGLDATSNEPRLKGARKANQEMRQLVLQVVSGLKWDRAAWLVLGQSLGKEFTSWPGPPLIGVVQEFRQDVLFRFQRQGRSLYQLLAELPSEARTAVFPRESQGHRGKIVYWYIRIRNARGLDFPLAGVVQVEMPNSGGDKVDTALVDHLSRHVVAERTVAPYGSGPAWHSQLYPLHLVEKVVQGRFHSEEVVKAGLRWKLPDLRQVFASNG